MAQPICSLCLRSSCPAVSQTRPCTAMISWLNSWVCYHQRALSRSSGTAPLLPEHNPALSCTQQLSQPDIQSIRQPHAAAEHALQPKGQPHAAAVPAIQSIRQPHAAAEHALQPKGQPHAAAVPAIQSIRQPHAAAVHACQLESQPHNAAVLPGPRIRSAARAPSIAAAGQANSVLGTPSALLPTPHGGGRPDLGTATVSVV